MGHHRVSRTFYVESARRARADGDAILPDTPMNRYSIAALEGWALSMDRLAIMPENLDIEMARDSLRRRRLAWLYGVDP
jgi:hypothetical protein